MSLFKKGDFTLHSGMETWFKIDADALTDEDLETLALLVAETADIWPFDVIEGVPTGGLRFAEALRKYKSNVYLPTLGPRLLIVDDVLTTGASMEEQRAGRRAQGVVIFARGRCPDWVVPLFQMMEDE